MATFDDHTNLAYSTLSNSPGTAGTSFILQTGHGARFPIPPFNATVWPAGTTALNTGVTNTTAEIVRVTAISTDTLTVTRTAESIGSGSTAANVAAGYQIIAGVTDKVMTDIEAAVAELTAFVSVSTGTTLSVTNQFVKVNAASGTVTITLPSAAAVGAGWFCNVKKSDSTTNTVTVATSSSQTIDGASSEPIRTPNASMMFVSDGSNWSIF